MSSLKESVTNITTTGSYVIALRSRPLGFKTISLTLTNSDGVNSLKYKVDVSNDPQGAADTWAEEIAEQVLSAGAAAKHVLSGPFVWVAIQVKDASGGSHAIANVYLLAVGIA